MDSIRVFGWKSGANQWSFRFWFCQFYSLCHRFAYIYTRASSNTHTHTYFFLFVRNVMLGLESTYGNFKRRKKSAKVLMSHKSLQTYGSLFNRKLENGKQKAKVKETFVKKPFHIQWRIVWVGECVYCIEH